LYVFLIEQKPAQYEQDIASMGKNLPSFWDSQM